MIYILKEPFSLFCLQELVRILGGLNDWAGLAPQLLGELEPDGLQEFTPMRVTVNYCGDNSWLNVQLWPEDEGERLLYGDKVVAFFAKLTGLNTVDVLIDFRDYKLIKRSILPLIKSF